MHGGCVQVFLFERSSDYIKFMMIKLDCLIWPAFLIKNLIAAVEFQAKVSLV